MFLFLTSHFDCFASPLAFNGSYFVLYSFVIGFFTLIPKVTANQNFIRACSTILLSVSTIKIHWKQLMVHPKVLFFSTIWCQFLISLNKVFTFLPNCLIYLRNISTFAIGKSRGLKNLVWTLPRVRLQQLILNRPIISIIAIKGPLNEGKHFFIELNFIGGLIQW